MPLDGKIIFLGLKAKHVKRVLSLGTRMEGYVDAIRTLHGRRLESCLEKQMPHIIYLSFLSCVLSCDCPATELSETLRALQQGLDRMLEKQKAIIYYLG